MELHLTAEQQEQLAEMAAKAAPAAEDLERICERIERDNPEAACRVARTIYDACTRGQEFEGVR